MPRYADWFRKVGDTAASPRALDVAKKLLGYLAIRRTTPGVKTMVKRIELDDGTVVTASFHGDQPSVVVDTSAAGGDICNLYVESGMLDLGPNIAADANDRFFPHPFAQLPPNYPKRNNVPQPAPVFANEPARLWFGDGVDCVSGAGGLNGRIRIRGKTITSECLPKHGASVESRLRDPKKKQAQAIFPASCWTGYMRRYMQAIYGGDQVTYFVPEFELSMYSPDSVSVSVGRDQNIRRSSVSPHAATTTGLVRDGQNMAFVEISRDGEISMRALHFVSCAGQVFKAWQSTVKPGDCGDQRLLTVALSGCIPGDTLGFDTADGFSITGTHWRKYGWSFYENRACAALFNDVHSEEDGSNSVFVREIEFTCVASRWRVVSHIVARGELPPRLVSVHVVNRDVNPFLLYTESRLARSRPVGALPPTDRWRQGDDYEHPVAAWYSPVGDMVVVWHVIASPRTLQDESGFFDCDGDTFTAIDGLRGRDDTHNCNTLYFGPDVSMSRPLQDRMFQKDVMPSRFARGVYIKSNGAILWSSVRERDCFVAKDTTWGLGTFVYSALATASYGIQSDDVSEEDVVCSDHDYAGDLPRDVSTVLGGGVPFSPPSVKYEYNPPLANDPAAPRCDYVEGDPVAGKIVLDGGDWYGIAPAKCLDGLNDVAYVRGEGVFTKLRCVVPSTDSHVFALGGRSGSRNEIVVQDVAGSADAIFVFDACGDGYTAEANTPRLSVASPQDALVPYFEGFGAFFRRDHFDAPAYSECEVVKHLSATINDCKNLHPEDGDPAWLTLGESFEYSDDDADTVCPKIMARYASNTRPRSTIGTLYKPGYAFYKSQYYYCNSRPLLPLYPADYSAGHKGMCGARIKDDLMVACVVGTGTQEATATGAYSAFGVASITNPDNEHFDSAQLYPNYDSSLQAPDFSKHGHSCSTRTTDFLTRSASGTLSEGHEPVMLETADGLKPLYEIISIMTSPYTGAIPVGPGKIARTSLLGASTRQTTLLLQGASVNMDRETITGGYPKVSTPSFVGWA